MNYGSVWGAALLLAVTSGCSLLVNPELEGGSGSKVFGQACADGPECASTLCTDMRCSQSCDTTNPCPNGSGSTCGTAGVCRFVAAGDGMFGDACVADGDCSSVLCVQERCSQACSASAPCPGVATECGTGGQCNFLPTGAVAFGGRCSAASDCETGRCVGARCTQPCSATATCPGDTTVCSDTTSLCDFLSPPATDPLKVGLLYVGPVLDHGWTLTHERSRQYFMEQIPGTTSEFASSVPPADAPRVIDEMIANGNNVIMGTSFDFLVPMLSKAQNNPDVNFMICSGFETGPNLGSYFGRMYQVMYMMGVVAGRVTRNNRIGIVGPVVIPETVRHTNAFTQGVRSVNLDATIYIEWVEAWFNPPVEESATRQLLDVADVDIVFGFTDTTIPMLTAATATTAAGDPVYVIGYDNRDSCDFAPTRCISSAYWNWGPMVTRVLEDMKAGTWDPQTPIWEQIKSTPEQSSAYFSDWNTDIVQPQVIIEVGDYIPLLTADTEAARMLPFAPPINDVMGRERLAEGQTFTDEDLLEMCWLVDGVKNVDGTPGTVPANCVGVR